MSLNGFQASAIEKQRPLFDRTYYSIYFSEIKDPRTRNRKQYPLEEILLVAVWSIITGGESLDDMVLFGENRLEFLKQFYIK